MKKIIIAVIVIVLLGAGTFVFLLKKNAPSQPKDSQATTNIEQSSLYNPSKSTFTQEEVAVQEQVKEKIQNDTIKTEYSTTPGSVLVDKYPKEVSPAKNPDYDTLYYPETNTFDVMLYTFPLEETRQRAGKYLVEKLGISEKEICRLRVTVGVVPSTSSTLAGQNLGLSFCPGSVDLSAYTENIDGVSDTPDSE